MIPSTLESRVNICDELSSVMGKKMKKLIALIISLTAYTSYSLDQGNALSCGDCVRTIPNELWDFMEGYEYEYAKGCIVVWHSRTSTFLYTGNTDCPEVSLEKMTSDALKSIDYVKKNTKYKDFSEYFYETKYKKSMQQEYSRQQSIIDARQIWNKACLGAKTLNFVSAEDVSNEYPYLEKIHVIRLIGSANNMVRGLGGVLNCAEQSRYVADIYTGDIDIRKK